MNRKQFYINLLLPLLSVSVMSQTATHSGRPRLVVNITIDQLNTTYLESFQSLYGEGGFKRLFHEGLIFPQASYPTSHTDRSSAIATLLTGTTPYYHGIVAQRWLDRQTLRPISSADPSALLVSTLGDELKIAYGGQARVVGIAPFQDAAVISAGHAADAAVWFDPEKGQWTTSAYYLNSQPYWALAFNDLKRDQIKGDKRFLRYQHSLFVNSEITEIALRAVSDQGMGIDDIPDLLSLTYYGGVPEQQPLSKSREALKDLYIRLDRDLASLISRLESRLGREQLLITLTSTGYEAPEEIDYEQYHIPSGTFYINRAANLLNMYFGALWGQDNYIEGYFADQLWLNRQLIEKKHISLTDAVQRAQEFLVQMSGVRNVYTYLQLLLGGNSQIEKARAGYHPQHSGDLRIEVAPGWHLKNEQTGDDRICYAPSPCFPIIVWGGSIEHKEISAPVSTQQIAPALARSMQIRAPNACTAIPLY